MLIIWHANIDCRCIKPITFITKPIRLRMDYALIDTAESAFLFRDRPVPRRSKASNVLKRPQPSLRVLRTNNA